MVHINLVVLINTLLGARLKNLEGIQEVLWSKKVDHKVSHMLRGVSKIRRVVDHFQYNMSCVMQDMVSNDQAGYSKSGVSYSDVSSTGGLSHSGLVVYHDHNFIGK